MNTQANTASPGASTADLVARLDEYIAARDRLRVASDEDESKVALDCALEAWHRLLDTRAVFSSEERSNG